MATKISGMTAGAAVSAADLFETVQGSNSRKVTAAQLKTFMSVGRRMRQTIGDGAAATFDVAHNFGTRDVHVTIYRNAAPYDTVIADVARPDINTVRISGFGSSPSVDNFVVMIAE